MRYRHLIWDWNGTLLDDGWLCVEVLNTILAEHNRPAVTLEHYLANFGFPVINYYQSLGFELTPAEFERLSHVYIARYEARRLECRLRPGAREAVAAVHARGVEQVILSAYLQGTLEEIVAHHGLSHFFDKLIGNRDIFAHGKAEHGRAHLASLPHEPDAVLLIGDTLHDLEVAEAIGADCVLMAGGHTATERLEATGRPVVDSPEAALAFLD